MTIAGIVLGILLVLGQGLTLGLLWCIRGELLLLRTGVTPSAELWRIAGRWFRKVRQEKKALVRKL